MASGAWALRPGAEIESAVRALRSAPDAYRGPVAVVDKNNAQIAVYGASGKLAGIAPALLGLASGETVFAGASAKLMQGTLPLAERTTPAGRYASVPGVNLKGERVVWIDYANALAIHRLRPAPRNERRPERLASPTAQDNRITLGCVVVDAAFFDTVVLPLLGRSPAVVVVLPESLPEP